VSRPFQLLPKTVTDLRYIELQPDRASAVLRRSERTGLIVCEGRRSRRASTARSARSERKRAEQSNSTGHLRFGGQVVQGLAPGVPKREERVRNGDQA
jgi:hypothetical protein